MVLLRILLLCATVLMGFNAVAQSPCPSAAIVIFDTPDSACTQVVLRANVIDSVNYQWYGHSGNIDSTDSPFYTVRKTGWYGVKIYNDSVGCAVISDSLLVTVYDTTPLIAHVTDTVSCIEDQTFTLSNFVTPPGGFYSGPYLTNNTIFNPTATGIDTIGYLYRNYDLCISHASFIIRVEHCVGVYEINQSSPSFLIVPNPSSGSFLVRVQLPSAQRATLRIFDALGQLCYESEQLVDPSSPNLSVNPLLLAKGIYTVQLKDSNTSAVQRLVVQ